ncbi:Opacity protein [Bosea sp. 62]|uniref:outer membrane protein n=1 Tax=Bosea sp. 21B TaxID=2768848 RepID=UPI00125B42F4|nr:outer membrane beta-barrel protein [Bosea sp. 21B]CAD5248152.1 Opacity protein [Bosea sp. 46]CAD5266563.1 Opacity protein [Bosea sp. 7B]VVT44955.1 Opacity protein [Bosea sp. EC-HK365B]VXB01695.1 Opacity protein [Bosea sp. 29B]VXB02339.1 Opacity protein [Bosea sp. 125]VXB88251.1 Opacity protein [Bosea sp. 62]VXC52266.1 Opacity protein [Bosea sp. 127]
MRSLKTLALAGAMAVSASAIASAADFPMAQPAPPPPPELRGTISSGIYLRGDIGVGVTNFGKYEQEDVRQANGTWPAKEDRSTSFFGGVGIGYRFNNWFRVDGTFEYRGGGSFGATDQVDLGGGTVLHNTYKGSISSMVALFNAYVDLGTWNCLTPYIGAGIGYASNRIHGVTDQGVMSTLNPGGWGPGYSTLGTANAGTKSGVAWALMAGVGYEVNKNLTLEVGYRYLNLGDAQSGRLVNAYGGQVQGPLKIKDIDSHDIKIGMRWNFGEPDCCGPVERPVAYAPAPVVRKY